MRKKEIKMKKSIVTAIMFIGFILVAVGALLEDPTIAMASAFSTPFLAAALAVCFIGAKNNVVKNVGFALATLMGIYGVALMVNGTLIVSGIGMIVMLLAALIYVVPVVLNYFGFVKGKENGTALRTDISSLLGKYKEMEAEKVINEEEFTHLKAKALQMLSEKENVNLDDLKKWKKLLDQQVINEEEFAQLKAKIFTK